MEYFSHDYHARHDPKLQHLLQEMKIDGIGIFWCLVEFCYEQGGRILESECERIAFDMRVDTDRIKRVLTGYSLFNFDGEAYFSETINKRLSLRESKKEKARNSAKIRWNHAFALRTHCEGNAIKESKLKEIKEKETKEEVPPDSADPRHKEFMKIFSDYWKANKVGEPPITGRDGFQLKALLKRQPDLTPEGFLRTMKKCDDDMFHGKNFSLYYLCSKYEIILNLKREPNVYAN